MRRTVDKMMRTWGRPVQVRRGEAEFRVRAFLQPVSANVERLAMPQVGALGRESRERFVFIGPAEPGLLADDRLESGGERYLVRSAQLIWAGEKPLYCWAMCVKEGGEPVWAVSG